MSDFFLDVQAGITLTLISVPTSVAYASLAGLPGIRGLKTPAASLIAFGLLSKVKWLASGATSLTAVTVKADLEEYAPGMDESSYVELVCLYALLVGFCSCALALLKLGRLAKMIPKPVMSGFKWGAACVILSSQAPDCLLGSKAIELGPLLATWDSSALSFLAGLPPTLSGFKALARLALIAASPLSGWRPATAALSAFTVWFLKGGGSTKLLPSKAPQGSEVLFVCVAATVVSVCAGYSHTHGSDSVIGTTAPTATMALDGSSSGGGDGEGVWWSVALAVLKDMAPQLHCLQLPWALVGPKLLLKALVFSAVDFSATVAICATFEQEDGLGWDANHELFTQGVSNLVAGFTGCQPVGGSLSRSLVNRATNAQSSRAAVVNGVCMVLMIPLLPLIEETPRCVLAAVVLSQIMGTVLDDKRTLRSLRGVDRFLAWTTAAATALSSPTLGIVLGCALSAAVAVSGRERDEKDV
eukprot:CAMPEP_0171922422 /NCGR_PEP_ID=MMETSP0993-20121228/21087_1 /TAXON_ID=483369 /ORGANISM="non described non described, Strain CCMP2098" /LENGTH=471 /DNA_ID=CAMNT_0012560075 /DNA_START=13 /DNA_END=1428 /DNA_ORIENTATION=-